MTTALATTVTAGLVASTALPPDRHPAAVYVASLTSPNSRKGMRAALDTAAKTMSGGAMKAAELDWAVVRFQHVAALRAALLDRLAPATVNAVLAAVRGTAKAAWSLGYIDADTLAKIKDGARSVKNERLPAGRSLGQGELRAMFDV